MFYCLNVHSIKMHGKDNFFAVTIIVKRVNVEISVNLVYFLNVGQPESFSLRR